MADIFIFSQIKKRLKFQNTFAKTCPCHLFFFLSHDKVILLVMELK
jgi:hypothetical protein